MKSSMKKSVTFALRRETEDTASGKLYNNFFQRTSTCLLFHNVFIKPLKCLIKLYVMVNMIAGWMLNVCFRFTKSLCSNIVMPVACLN